jgi:hypothetical protein
MAVTACVDPAFVIKPGPEPTVTGSRASNHSGVARRETLRKGIGGAIRRGDGDVQAAHAAISGDRVRRTRPLTLYRGHGAPHDDIGRGPWLMMSLVKEVEWFPTRRWSPALQSSSTP